MKGFVVGLITVFAVSAIPAHAGGRKAGPFAPVPIAIGLCGILGQADQAYGLDVQAGERFTGRFVYDHANHIPVSFSVAFPRVELAFGAADLSLIENDRAFNLRGHLNTPAGPATVNINLSDPNPFRDHVSCADWDVCNLVVWPFDAAPGFPPYGVSIVSSQLFLFHIPLAFPTARAANFPTYFEICDTLGQ